ncbi:MAG: hypothetical protein QM791_10280 [Ferruginibacter sp.]
MKQLFVFIFFTAALSAVKAQTAVIDNDSGASGKVTVYKDPRLNELTKKEAAFNELLANATRAGKGYRLLVLSSNDRNLVMKVRGQLLQRFPEQKVYMSFQPPYIKLKFGNFVEKADAENYRKEIVKAKLVTTNIYTVPEKIEIKPEKNKEKENQ